jgi:[ribosomal protein S5]-alanine N-acetyltransferase
MLLPTEIPGCVLRPWHPDDKPSLIRHANNRNVWRNLTHMFPHPYTHTDADAWVSVANQPSSSLHYAIVLESEAVGGIGAIAGEGISQRTAQFGYWLGEAHWHKGIATAAARAMIGHLGSTHAFSRLEAPVFEWNTRSMRVLEKVGFVREGVLTRSVFKDGQLIDSVMYALIADALGVTA